MRHTRVQGAARSSARVRARVATTAVLALAAPALLSGAAQARTVPPATAGRGTTPLATAGRGTTPPTVTERWTAETTERWTTETLAPGVTVRTGVVEHPGVRHSWTITVQAPSRTRWTSNDPDAPLSWAEVGTRAWAEDTASELTRAALRPRVESVRWPDYADTPRGVMGLRVRVGRFATQEEAKTAASAVTAAGFHPALSWTGYDVQEPADRENIHVAVIDPKTFEGRVEATHDGDVTRRETTSAVARKLNSLVGVNGGFFVLSPGDGVPGTMSGIGAYRGELESMAAGSRSALLVQDGGHRLRIADLTSTVTARAGGAAYRVQGINRLPGTVRDCGRPGGTPSELPWQDVTCRLADDLVLFTPAFRAGLPSGPGAQAVLDASGRVVSVGARGGRVPEGGRVLQGIGRAADWLTAHARPDSRVRVGEAVRTAEGGRVTLDADDSLVSAAPTLVEDGRIDIDAAAEGVVDPAYTSFGYAWANVRQPRTLAGVDRRGRLILATVDGRLKGGSEGFTLHEAAAFMQSLGAVRAMNLDGGGSTAMAVGGTLVNQPSDAAGERAVGDTVQVLPAGH
ncbi:phosphodiester glycosidase family protein [Streptomyces naphthomycinicus]|uniref:phosphodiester glycosidase family protein n=1 Tax=Streptomyces naphthomycinicus TaxID=2872625 RepID=UPI001CEC9FAF|nr:phosphodiester glycosidase family protein [Streptomyces sp. TML10]